MEVANIMEFRLDPRTYTAKSKCILLPNTFFGIGTQDAIVWNADCTRWPALADQYPGALQALLEAPLEIL
jgi:hypothetical protein